MSTKKYKGGIYVAFGDSITNNTGAARFNSYTQLVAKELGCTLVTKGVSGSTIAKNIGTSTSTAWTCRMKIYQTIQNIYCEHDKCDGLIEADGKYLRVSFKGCKDKNWFIDKLGRLPKVIGGCI